MDAFITRISAASAHPASWAPGVEPVATLAQRYCALIEAAGDGRRDWLTEVAALLPRLRVAMIRLSWEPPPAALPRPDLDARFELFSRLRRLLDDRDPYWLEFDRPEDGGETLTGSLADDLTDIYWELREGLRALRQDPAAAVALWKTGYARHWSRHLVDAERHLSLLAARGRLAA